MFFSGRFLRWRFLEAFFNPVVFFENFLTAFSDSVVFFEDFLAAFLDGLVFLTVFLADFFDNFVDKFFLSNSTSAYSISSTTVWLYISSANLRETLNLSITAFV